MKIDILTIFPSMFSGPFDTSMLKKAIDGKLVEINIHDLRNWAEVPHRKVDDRPFGGGAGMVLKVEPIYEALKSLKKVKKNTRVIVLSPQGQAFDQAKAKKLAREYDHLILIAGHYEGFDERIIENLADEEISIGDYILTGGEIPAMVVTDAVTRLLPGVLTEEAKGNESFSDGKTLDYPNYTRPSEFRGWKVPEILLTGDHKKITEWRVKKATEKTSKKDN